MLQALPLDLKIMRTQQRIREWVQYYGTDGVCVSFSGGKDSTVLLHLARQIYPNIKAVFSDTGLEYPEIRNFVKCIDNVDWVKPKQSFHQIILECGYPLFSKEISEAIRYARKIVGGGQCDFAKPNFSVNVTEENGTAKQQNCRRKKLQGFYKGKRMGTNPFLIKKSICLLAKNFPF